MNNSKKVLKIKEQLLNEYLKDDRPWIIGYSGGKDSSAVVKILYQALLELDNYHKSITILNCDTGVEIPVVQDYVKKTLINVQQSFELQSIPIKIVYAKPLIKNSFFVKVIGYGYPPPTNIFRWCTDRLRINPVKETIDSFNKNKNAVVLLGVRKGESKERNKIIDKYYLGNNYLKQVNNNNVLVYAPLLKFSTNEIWKFLSNEVEPNCIDGIILNNLYQKASDTGPSREDFYDLSCGDARFGCWTCTVIRKDKAVQNLIKEGYDYLIPLFEFRNWLQELREKKTLRYKLRRNGQKGPGPFTLKAREYILNRLLKVESETGLSLITNEEIEYIKDIWQKDTKYHNK